MHPSCGLWSPNYHVVECVNGNNYAIWWAVAKKDNANHQTNDDWIFYPTFGVIYQPTKGVKVHMSWFAWKEIQATSHIL